MLLPFKSRIYPVVVYGSLLFFALCTRPAIAPAETGVPVKLVVGAMDFPPFTYKSASGVWEGLSIELVQAVARELNTEIELREFSRTDQFEKALTTGEIDLAAVAAITEHLESVVDFSNPYYRSGAAIAVKTAGGGNKMLLLADHLFSVTALKVIVSLGLLWVLAGSLVWLFERRRHLDMFSGSFWPGLGNGIWWAAVTMTTVGYGDKAPRTVGGRIIAIIWMFASIVLISSFTATVATTFTIDELKNKVRGFNDLPNVRVGTLAHSQFLEHMADYGIAATPYEKISTGLQALAADKIDAFVHDEALLKHLIRTRYPGTLQVLPDTSRHYYFGMALPFGCEWREPFNQALLKVMNRKDWRMLLERKH